MADNENTKDIVALEKGAIVQVTREGHSLQGHLLIVYKVNDWACYAYVQTGHKQVTPLRLEYGEFELVGRAILMPYFGPEAEEGSWLEKP